MHGNRPGLRTVEAEVVEQRRARLEDAPSTLSRLEGGKRRLTVDHLGVLATALGTSVDALLAPEPKQDPRVRLLLGDDELLLDAGEAAEFSTWTPHWLGAVDEEAEVLALMGPQGERVHLRAT